jgi:integrase
MIAYKEALGYCAASYEYYLWKLDEYCCLHYPDETNLTKELVNSWAIARAGESINTLNRRLAAVREFGRYLKSVGVSAYVLPSKMTGPQKRFTPHIFTDAELKSFFYGTDNFERSVRDPLYHYIVPVIFRLIYCCGLRPNEGRLIKTEDMDINTGKIHIRESKRHKDRLVMMTDALLRLCQSYIYVLKQYVPKSEYLFPDIDGKPHSAQWLEYQFRKCWKIAKIEHRQRSQPRVYDFRHTFATKRLHDWMDQKEDLFFWLPYLCAYMGHSHFSSTAYYIHLLPERLTSSPAINWKVFSDLMPEVPV